MFRTSPILVRCTDISPIANVFPTANHTVSVDSLVGQTLGHYCVLAKIGAGGIGEVYRAHDEHLDREVAIKVLPPGTLGDESARKRFRKEALALSKLNHPNIATIHDLANDEPKALVSAYVIMVQ